MMKDEDLLNTWGLTPAVYQTNFFGSGLINHTLKVEGKGEAYILQQINTDVFTSPDDIAENLKRIDNYLKNNYPDYLFAAPLPTISGDFSLKSPDGNYYRLLPFIKGSHTVNFLEHEQEAFEAAKQFGKFSRLLNNFDIALLKYTLPGFHNLKLRFDQFKKACETAKANRLNEASDEIKEAQKHINIINTWQQLTENSEIPLRVIHHDTKINNVLFDDDGNGLCVIDLDTIMPGYFLSDTGDMMRTYLSPANEEETDLSKIYIRHEFFSSIYKGYMQEMGKVLTSTEKEYFIFSGSMMIYMQALRFLTDFLNGDIYYGASYPRHNLVRAKNQFTLLNKYIAAEAKFEQLIAEAEKELSYL
jgi:thiamine kinase-like enzyme